MRVLTQESAGFAAIPGFSMVSGLLTRTTSGDKVAMMTAEQGSANENLLEQIATTEQELEKNVAGSREEARRIVDEARRKADAERQAALREADELSARARSEITRESEAVSAQRLAEAKADAERVRAQAAARMSAAVAAVVDRVLAGLEPR